MSVVEAALDLSVIVGDWRNTNPAAGITRIVCEPSHDGLTIDCSSAVRGWGKVDADVFAFEFDAIAAGAFSAFYDFGFADVRVQANVKQGVLVVVTLTAFKDGSGRAGYFNREFFYRS